MLKIDGIPGDILSVRLEDILDTISDDNKLIWSVIRLRGVSFRGKISTLVVEDVVDISPDGLILTKSGLYKFANNFSQIIDIVIIADKKIEKIMKYQNDKEMFEGCELVLALIDSSYWVVQTETKNINDSVKTMIPGTLEMEEINIL